MSTFSEIADQVTARAAELSRLLKEAQVPEPTFKESGARDFDSASNAAINNEAFRTARNALINAAQDLAHLTMGPADYLSSMSWSASKIANLGCLVRLDIPKRIPAGGSRQLGELVKEIGIDELIAERVIRYAVANSIFIEGPEGVISHSAASARLATDKAMADYCMMWASEISSLQVKMPEALARKQALGDRAPDSAANIAFPEYTDLFDYFDKRVDAAQRYSTYLAARAAIPSWSANYLVDAWDWKAVGSGTVVDCGGSAGSTSQILARAYPNLNVVNQDISPEALKEGEAQVKKAGLDSRVKYVLHNFYEPQTVTADAYIFKSIMHDWNHEACVKMVKALLPAMKHGAHVLIGECLMPEPPALRETAWDYEAKRVEDQIMIAGHNAYERSLEQFKAIFRDASEYFQFEGVTTDANGSVFSLIDFSYQVPN